MEGKKFLRTIRLENILSFGPGGDEFPMEPLNVFIGPNASGKSNLIEVLTLLAAAPRDLQTPIRTGGGVSEWLWKGESRPPDAAVEVTAENPRGPMPLRYRLAFTESAARFRFCDEVVENEDLYPDVEEKPYSYYNYNGGHPAIKFLADESRLNRRINLENVNPEQSILSQRRDPDVYPELTWLASQFEGIRFYREWNFVRSTPPRLPQQPDLPQDYLFEDASNLGVVLSNLLNRPPVKRRILEGMRTFYARVEDIVVNITGGTAQIFFHEEGLQHPVPATRVSDGSLRYLCLLAVLCHPEPPPVICIEEPEISLHPDIIPELAKLLLETSAHSQIFITTHSDILVDALTDTPEAVVVCEKHDGATELQRLNKAELKHWLDKYRLGEIWSSGVIGGNRW